MLTITVVWLNVFLGFRPRVCLSRKRFLLGSTQSVNGFNQSAHSLNRQTTSLRVNFWIQNLYLSSAEHSGTIGGSKHRFFFFNENSASGVDERWREVLDLWNNCGGYNDYVSDFVYWRLWPKSLRARTESQGQSPWWKPAFLGCWPCFFLFTPSSRKNPSLHCCHSLNIFEATLFISACYALVYSIILSSNMFILTNTRDSLSRHSSSCHFCSAPTSIIP